MKANAITDKILDDARVAAADTLREARARAEQLKKDAKSEIASRRRKTMLKAREECALIRKRMLRMTELEQRKAELAVKRDIMDRAFDGALKKLSTMRDVDRLDFYTSLILSAAEGDEMIVVNYADAVLFTPDALASVNRHLIAIKKKGELTLSDERRDTGGGLFLKKGGMEINCTFPALVNHSRPGLEADVAAMLFGEG